MYSVYFALHTGCGFIYRGCDVISTVCNDIRIGCVVLYSAYDVTQKLGVISLKSGCDISGEVVMTKIQWVQYLIQGV